MIFKKKLSELKIEFLEYVFNVNLISERIEFNKANEVNQHDIK